jgi:hypothetical protein
MMIKKAVILAVVVCLALVMLIPGVTQAQGELRILDSSAEAEFPLRLNFSLSAESDVNITDIRLHYTVDQERFAEVISEVYIEFVPASRVDESWTWDMRRTGGLPPGSRVEYWWTVEDANGRSIETVPVQVEFNDERYSWKSLTEGEVTIYWYKGDESFADEIMLAVKDVLARLAEDTGAYLEKPVQLYIYQSASDLRGSMIFPQEWTGGVAFTRYGTIAIGISPNNLVWGRGAVSHELTHLVIHQMTLNPYNDLPTWLDEGLAMHSEGPLNPQFTSALNRAINNDSLISVQSLSSPFSAFAEESYLSYAQSYSLVEFLIREYGKDKMLELLRTFKEGSSYDGALEEVYGFDRNGLDTLWREYIIEPAPTVEERHAVPGGALAVLAVGLPLALGMVAGHRLARRRW